MTITMTGNITHISSALLQRAHLQAIKAVDVVPLSLQGTSRSSLQGSVLWDSPGNSLDFYDHRIYQLGDDPRYIDWRALARTGNYTMKLFQQEIAPKLEIVFDLSHSMLFSEAKALRALSLFYLAVELGNISQATMRIFGVAESQLLPFANEAITAYDCEALGITKIYQGAPLALSQLPFRHRAQRVLISDLLFPEDPRTVMNLLAANEGQGIILCPYLEEEQAPSWLGNLTLHDCESGSERRQQFTAELMQDYQQTYQRHFRAWQEAAERHRFFLLRIPCSGGLSESMLEALSSVTGYPAGAGA